MWRFKIAIFLIPFVLIFGEDQDRILFQHAFHVEDMELSCTHCHEGVEDADRQTWSIFPEMDTCLECHDDDTADGSCEYCHTNPDNPLPISESWNKSELGFSHKKHLDKYDDCSKCHNYINEDSEIDVPKVWVMSECQDCHMNLEEGPNNHDLAWKQLHGAEVNGSTIGNCELCHTNNSCEECHQLQEFSPNVHPVDYILLHSFEAKAGVIECSTCHNIIEDCYTCHVTNQIMPMNHNFHNWVSTEGGLHIDFAESEAELCATCHIPTEDATCLECHLGD
jgi:hypothetical protein